MTTVESPAPEVTESTMPSPEASSENPAAESSSRRVRHSEVRRAHALASEWGDYYDGVVADFHRLGLHIEPELMENLVDAYQAVPKEPEAELQFAAKKGTEFGEDVIAQYEARGESLLDEEQQKICEEYTHAVQGLIEQELLGADKRGVDRREIFLFTVGKYEEAVEKFHQIRRDYETWRTRKSGSKKEKTEASKGKFDGLAGMLHAQFTPSRLVELGTSYRDLEADADLSEDNSAEIFESWAQDEAERLCRASGIESSDPQYAILLKNYRLDLDRIIRSGALSSETDTRELAQEVERKSAEHINRTMRRRRGSLGNFAAAAGGVVGRAARAARDMGIKLYIGLPNWQSLRTPGTKTSGSTSGGLNTLKGHEEEKTNRRRKIVMILGAVGIGVLAGAHTYNALRYGWGLSSDLIDALPDIDIPFMGDDDATKKTPDAPQTNEASGEETVASNGKDTTTGWQDHQAEARTGEQHTDSNYTMESEAGVDDNPNSLSKYADMIFAEHGIDDPTKAQYNDVVGALIDSNDTYGSEHWINKGQTIDLSEGHALVNDMREATETARTTIEQNVPQGYPEDAVSQFKAKGIDIEAFKVASGDGGEDILKDLGVNPDRWYDIAPELYADHKDEMYTVEVGGFTDYRLSHTGFISYDFASDIAKAVGLGNIK